MGQGYISAENNGTFLAEAEMRREESDDEGWQEKEASRTVSVKFTDDYDAEKEDGNKEVRISLVTDLSEISDQRVRVSPR